MHGICCFYNFKFFKACRFLTAFSGCFEFYIYSTLFIGMSAMHNLLCSSIPLRLSLPQILKMNLIQSRYNYFRQWHGCLKDFKY